MITANEIKTRGVKVIEEQLEHADRVGITVRGKVKYVVMPVESYDAIHEMELDKALAETREDIKNGDYVIETAEEHLKRLWHD